MEGLGILGLFFGIYCVFRCFGFYWIFWFRIWFSILVIVRFRFFVVRCGLVRCFICRFCGFIMFSSFMVVLLVRSCLGFLGVVLFRCSRVFGGWVGEVVG